MPEEDKQIRYESVIGFGISCKQGIPRDELKKLTEGFTADDFKILYGRISSILAEADKDYNNQVKDYCERGSQDPNMGDFYDNEVRAEHIGLGETRKACDGLTVALKDIEPK